MTLSLRHTMHSRPRIKLFPITFTSTQKDCRCTEFATCGIRANITLQHSGSAISQTSLFSLLHGEMFGDFRCNANTGDFPYGFLYLNMNATQHQEYLKSWILVWRLNNPSWGTAKVARSLVQQICELPNQI